jgi:hypothetical protein
VTGLQSSNNHHWPKVKRIQGELLNISQCKLGPKTLQLVILVYYYSGYIPACEVQVNDCDDPRQKHGGYTAYPQYVWWSSLPPLIPLSARA